MSDGNARSVALRRASETLKRLGKELDHYDVRVSGGEYDWLVHFLPIDPDQPRGDIRIRITKDTLQVEEILSNT